MGRTTNLPHDPSLIASHILPPPTPTPAREFKNWTSKLGAFIPKNVLPKFETAVRLSRKLHSITCASTF